MADREIVPLKTLGELLDFKEPLLCSVEPLRNVKRGGPNDPKILFCHDMMGGYLEDRFIHGCEKHDSYRFHHWQLIDSFVYFSHYMVTIPPPGWISAGHKHGVKVLGTFIVEAEPGTKILNEIREGNLSSKVASQLALIAAAYKFDGWLINIESEMDKSCGPFLKEFLKAVTLETHRAVPGSLVIWYDSVLPNGKLDWQNELNSKNSCFFDLCDGIFLNYAWTEKMLQKSAILAGSRKTDVYVGIDVFAWKTKYAGGYETFKAVEVARKHGLSSAIFAAGWVYETQDKKKFAENQCRFWDFPEHCRAKWRLSTLPLRTSFCQGFGENLYNDGKVVQHGSWFNLSKQQLQPCDQGSSLCEGCGTAAVCTDYAYNGGSCLLLRFVPDAEKPEASPYFRLFPCNLPLGSLCVSYTFAASPDCSNRLDVTLVFKVQTASGKKEELFLGAAVSNPSEERYEATRDVSDGPAKSSVGSGCHWQTRKYLVKDLAKDRGATLEEIGVFLLSFDSTVAGSCLLGELVLKRPDDASGNKTVHKSSSDEGLEDSVPDIGAQDDEAEPHTKRQRV
ncbi:cytosolic endo-beta-N-acetylglucosaminidase-like [Dermacentor albipictus]|uniref:cytosolic endo-beta-N-acetylglucosaminidase-like n=1 Tax=Dermacentor albipictus TaxID=60249 RepID=UPI0031FE26F0